MRHFYRPKRKRTKPVALDEIVARFPLAFRRAGTRPLPLKVGIYADLKAADRDWRPRDLISIMSAYVGSMAYLRALVEGAPRVGLDGLPVGIVTPHHARYAAKLLRARIAAKVRARPSIGVLRRTIIRERSPSIQRTLAE